MATHREIRAEIAATMNLIANIGIVHEYERYAANKADLAALYAYNNQLRGWYIRRISRRENSPDIGRHTVLQQWRIRGFLSLSDAIESELVFDDLCDAVVDGFRANDTLNNLVDSCIIERQAGAQIEDSGPVMFAGVLCHSAQLLLTTRHYL